MRASLILSAALLLLSSTPAAAQKRDLEVQLGEQTFAPLRDQVIRGPQERARHLSAQVTSR